MRTAIILPWLLFCTCGAQTWTDVQAGSQGPGSPASAELSSLLDISSEIQELRDMVLELRVQLRITQNDLESTKAAMKTKVEGLEMENAAQQTEMTLVKTRLSASEAELKNLKLEITAAQTAEQTDTTTPRTEEANLTKDSGALETNLSDIEATPDSLKMDRAVHDKDLKSLKARLAATETKVETLETKLTTPKVAFSAALTDSGTTAAINTDLNLVFSRIITNVGQAYSSRSGIFTAPVSGVYYFRFTVVDHLASRMMVIQMFKNGHQVMFLNEYGDDGQATYLSSGVTLQLQVGDEVSMKLPAGYRVYDNGNNHSTFSGFLLFALNGME